MFDLPFICVETNLLLRPCVNGKCCYVQGTDPMFANQTVLLPLSTCAAFKIIGECNDVTIDHIPSFAAAGALQCSCTSGATFQIQSDSKQPRLGVDSTHRQSSMPAATHPFSSTLGALVKAGWRSARQILSEEAPLLEL
eukprot:m.266353 g.266353  ORF g.266353 m.266353 type:complete len:139 (-) comp15630_c0_seq7:592-1008(-)